MQTLPSMAPFPFQLARKHFPMWILLLLLLANGAAEDLKLPTCANGSGHCGSGNSHSHMLAAPYWSPFQFEHPVSFSGSRVQDYTWGSIWKGEAWIEAKRGASRDEDSYAALSYELPAADYLGQRVRLKADVAMNGVTGSAFGALFVRVVSGDGLTLAFDNMYGRRIVSWKRSYRYQQVVVDVPWPLDGDSCPAEGSPALPAVIRVGFLLCGGRGYMKLSAGTFEAVSRDVPVTGGPPPWEGPGISI